MNFQYSYRAFLITSLLTGCLVLFLYSLKLSKNKVQVEEEIIDVEITSEDLLLLEQELAAVTPEEMKIETNKGYNEDRKSTRLNSSHVRISYAVFCLKKKK